jgi:proline dehydrogenase
MVDAEESWFQNTVDALAQEAMAKYNKKRAIVFNTIQLYRHDRLAFLKESFEAAEANGYFLGVKLVRGAYLEKENKYAAEKGVRSPINTSKELTDKSYDDALRFCIEHIDRISVCAGTHNEQSAKLLTQLMDKAGIEPKDPRLHFAQLLGMSDHLSFNLAAKGYNVAKYVPYGKVNELLPYLTRRAQENSSVLGQTSRELNLLTSEMKRRGLKR